MLELGTFLIPCIIAYLIPIGCGLKEEQHLIIVKLIMALHCIQFPKKHEKNVAIMRCMESSNCLHSQIYFQ